MSTEKGLSGRFLNADALNRAILRKITSLKKDGESDSAFAARCGIKQTTFSGWMTAGRTPSVAGLISIASANEITVNDLIYDERGFPLANGAGISYVGSEGLPGFVRVRKIKTKLSAGPGAFVYEEDDDDTGYYFREDWLIRWCNPADVLMFDVDGNSSEPLIRSADSVLMNKAGHEIIEGEFYAIRHGDVLKLKQLSWQLDGRIEVKSFNPDADEKSVITNPDEIEILGQIFWRCGLIGSAARRQFKGRGSK